MIGLFTWQVCVICSVCQISFIHNRVKTCLPQCDTGKPVIVAFPGHTHTRLGGYTVIYGITNLNCCIRVSYTKQHVLVFIFLSRI